MWLWALVVSYGCLIILLAYKRDLRRIILKAPIVGRSYQALWCMLLSGVFLPTSDFHGIFKASCVTAVDGCSLLSADTCSTNPSCALISACQTNRCSAGDPCCGLSADSCSANPVCQSGFECMPQYNDCAFRSTEDDCKAKGGCAWDASKQVSHAGAIWGP